MGKAIKNRLDWYFLRAKRALIGERARKNAEIGDFGSNDWDRTSDLGLMSPTL